MKGKGILVALVIACIIIGGYFITQNKSDDGNQGKQKYKIGLTQIVEHPSLNTIRDSFLKEMKNLGYVEGENIKYLKTQANGEVNLLASIMDQYKNDKVDVIVPITTPAAVAAAKYAKEIPVVFSAVSDPIGAKLTTNLDKPDKNITGTSDVIQIEKIMKLSQEMFPKAKSVGAIYNSGEANSVSNIEKVKSYCKKHNLKYYEVNVANTSELSQAASVICGKADIIFSPNDNTVASGMDAVTTACIKAKKPFFVGADSMVKDNGFATVGINYEELGKQTASMVDKVLKGKKIADIPVMEFKDNLSIYVNEKVAKEIGYTIPESIKNMKGYTAIK